MKRYIELTVDHVGSAFLNAFGRSWQFSNFMGPPLPHDVGKRVYLVGGILQVENDDQRAARMAREIARQYGTPYKARVALQSANFGEGFIQQALRAVFGPPKAVTA